MPTLYIIRGLPGSGKSTKAREMAATLKIAHFEADMYFERTGKYEFDITELSDAHSWCTSQVRHKLIEEGKDVVVSNTFTKFWEMENLLQFAHFHKAKVKVIHCTSSFGSIHFPPEATLEKMRKRFQSNEHISNLCPAFLDITFEESPEIPHG